MLVGLSVAVVNEWLDRSSETEPVVVYSDRAAFDECIARIPESDGDFRRRVPPVRDCYSQYVSQENVLKDSVSLYEFVKPELDEIVFAALIYFSIIFFLLLAIRYVVKYESKGWRRLALVVSIFPTLVVAYLIVNDVGGDDYWSIAIGAFASYSSTLLVVLIGRSLFLWIQRGFNIDNV